MCKVTLTAGLCLIIIGVVSSSKLVCYYNSLAVSRPQHGNLAVPDIDPFKCTHLIYAFADINDQHELVPKHAADLQRYHDFNQLKVRNPLLKTLLAVGGVKFNKTKFSAMVSTQENRQKFIQSAITVVRGNEFDGLNLDWKYPGAPGGQPEDKERFSALCEELKVAFEAEGSTNNRDRLIIAASVSAKKEVIDAGYEVAAISQHLDFISVLTFDFHDSKSSTAQHHSPLFSGPQDTGDKIFSSTDSAIQYWLDQGTPPDKLNLGLALYGRVFTLTSTFHNVGAPVRGAGDEGGYTREPGSWASYEICLYIKSNTVQLIPDQRVPYATVDHQWVGFDDKKSLEAKVNYLKSHNLGGAIVWSVDLDDFSGQFCGMGEYPFISYLNNILIAGPIDHFCAGQSDGLYNITNFPKAFYNCTHGLTKIQLCQNDLIFNTGCNCCDTPSATTIKLLRHERSVDFNFCYGRPDGRYSVPNTPRAFYNCGHGRTYIQYCQQGLVYDMSCDCCNYPPTQTNMQDNSGTGGSPDLNFCHGRPDGRYSVPNNPRAFYNCGHGITHIQYCQQGLVYDMSCDCCNYPSPQTNTQDNSGTGGSADLNFCHGRPDGRYSVPNNPRAFYNCGHGITHIQYCQQGLVYDMSCDCCNYPPTQTNTQDNSGTGGSPDLNFCHGRPDGRYSVPNNPRAFYNCGHGITHIQYCQQGLVYDMSCDCCNYPSTHNTHYPTAETKTTSPPTTHTHYPTAPIITTETTTTHDTTTTPVTKPSCDQVCFGRICKYYKSTKYHRAFYKCSKDLTSIQCCQKDLIFKKWCDRCNPLFTKTTRLSSRTKISTPCKTRCRGTSNVKCVGKSNGCNRGLKNLRNFFNCGKGLPSMPFCQRDLVFKNMSGCFFNSSAKTTPTCTFSNTTSTQSCGDCFTSIQYCHKDLVFILYVCNCNCTTETTSTPDTTTPPVNTDNFCDGRPNGRYSVPYNPRAFYSCVNGTTQMHYCQPGHFFNESCECCEDPSPETKTTTDPNDNPGTGGSADLTFCYGRPDGLYSVPNNPGAFYNCGHGRTHIQYCQQGLVFRQSCKCCDYPSTHNVHYNSGYDNHYTQHMPVTTTTTHYTTRPQMSSHSFCYGKTDGLYNVPNVPRAFYNCAGGSTHVHYCQAGLVFKKSCDCCEHPSDETSPTPTTTTTSTPYTTRSHVSDNNFCYGRADGRYSVPHVPAAFYNCAYGQTYIQYCQNGLVYNPSCDCCDHSSNHYNPTPTTATTTSTHYTTRSQVFDDNFCHGRANGRYAVPNVPTAFYSCAYGETDIRYCQNGLVFKQSCYCCDNPSDETSPTPTTTTTTTTTSTHYTSPTPTTTTTSAHDTTRSHVFDNNFCYGRADGRYSVPHVPAAFYNCAYGQTYIQYCQNSLVYNPSCDCCDHSSNHYSPIPTTATTTSTHYTTRSHVFDDNFCHGRANGRYAVPNVPTAFYSCAYGETDIRYCQNGLVFKQSCYCCDNPSDETSPTPTTTTTTTTTSTHYTSPTPTTTTTSAHDTTRSHVFDNNFCYGRADGRYSVPHVPAAFYNCAYGQTYIQYCQNSLVYNPSCDCCDHSSNHYNPMPTTAATTSTHYTTRSQVFNNNFCYGRANGRYAVPNVPTAFYSCAYGETDIHYCQNGLVFKQSCYCCDNPSDETSPTPTTTTTTSTHYTSPTPTTTTTASPHYTTRSQVFNNNFCYGRADGRYSVPHVPAAFYNCAYGQTYIQYCHNGLVYNPSCDCCDRSSNHYNPIPTTTTTQQPSEPTTAYAVFDDNFCYGKADGLHSAPNHSGAFYNCAHGTTHLQFCQQGLVFKESCKCCNFP